MRCLVVVRSKSPGITSGLTYESGNLPVQVGSLVRVPMREGLQEGMVIQMSDKKSEVIETFAVKNIAEVISPTPLLTQTQIDTAQWMAQYYFCSLRAALTPFLASDTWSTLLKEPKKKVEKNIHPQKVRQEFTLSPEQQAVYESMKKDARPSLLFGVTGSGKTEVYARMIEDVFAQGKQVIVLVPEILLTEHIILRLEELFPRDIIAIVHSKLTPAARRREWQRVRSGNATLIIGSRSALFSPCPNLGLVIIDEEHEWTYKNEQTPRYHARETAQALCKAANAKLILGSATPSLESWKRAKDGHYHIARLPNRYNNQAMPSVRVIDLAEVKFGNHYPFSPPLIDAIQDRLRKKEQCVLFLNHRGSATSVLCLGCRRRLTSPISQLPFTLHYDSANRPFLLDHFSGATAVLPVTCPHCQAPKLHPLGAGTQRIEAILTHLLPDAKLLRADSDTLESAADMKEMLRRMKEGEVDILIGTQSVVKGLDLPNVTLAAVLVADVGLSLPHFRAGERIFQLLTQLTGRSGRAKAGDVLIQTFRPDAVEVQAAATHRTEAYLEAELQLRTQCNYPPTTPMIRFIIRGELCEKRATALHASILRLISDKKMQAQALIAPTLFGQGKVWHVLLRGAEVRSLLADLDLTDVVVDIDPLECL